MDYLRFDFNEVTMHECSTVKLVRSFRKSSDKNTSG